jgi:hypothetical protein
MGEETKEKERIGEGEILTHPLERNESESIYKVHENGPR